MWSQENSAGEGCPLYSSLMAQNLQRREKRWLLPNWAGLLNTNGNDFIVLGPKPSAVLCDPSSSSVCLLCVPFPCRGGRLAAFRLEVRASPHVCVRHCHLVEPWDRQPAGSWTPRWVGVTPKATLLPMVMIQEGNFVFFSQVKIIGAPFNTFYFYIH